MRFSFILCPILFLLSTIMSYGQEEGAPLLSSHITLKSNSIDGITLTWNRSGQSNRQERVLLFIPGPVSSATYAASRFTWSATHADGTTTGGDRESFPIDKKWRTPQIMFRELGCLAGARLAVLTLNLNPNRSYSTQEDAPSIVFPSGEIDVQFEKIDEESFTNFPSAVGEVAEKLVLNHPPLRVAKSSYQAPTFAKYFDGPVMKIRSKDNGIVTLSEGEIRSALGGDIQIENVSLYRERNSIPYVLTDSQGNVKRQGSFERGDTLQFYSPKSQSSYSPETVTWIAPQPGVQADAAQTDVNSSATAEALERRIHLEEDRVFIEGGNKNETQNNDWMWCDFIHNGTKTIEFSQPAEALNRPATARLRFRASQSYVALATNCLYVDLNGTPLKAEVQRDQLGEYHSNVIIAPEAIKPGTNALTVNIYIGRQYSQSDVGVFLNDIEIQFAARVVHSNEPYWYPEGNQCIALPKQHGGAWLINKNGNTEKEVLFAPASAKTIAFPTPAEEWRLYISSPETESIPNQREKVSTPLSKNTLLSDDRGADVLIVAPGEWLPVLKPFEDDLRKSNYRVRHAAIEDVNNLFGDGRMSPHHLRAFLRYAYHRWNSPRPSYVFFIGDASWDYWGRYDIGVRNYVPTYREEEKYATENWFARLDDIQDNLPDAIVARWPMQSAEDLRTVIQKTLAYKTHPPLDEWFNQAFVLTDDTFEKYSQELLDEWIPPQMRVLNRHIADYSLIDNIYLPERLRERMRAKTSPTATNEIIETINRGVFLWDYFGHGAPNVLGNERMFFGGGSKYSDVKKLTNRTKPPILWAYTCQTAEFDYPREKWNVSIGEDLLTFPNGGAIALVGATGRGYPTDHIVLARGMHQAAFRDGLSTLGQIFFAANLYGMSNSSFFEPLRQFALLGDPSVVFPKFQTVEGKAVREEKQISFEWKGNEEAANPGSYTIWAETDRAIVPDKKQYRFDKNSKTIEGVLPIKTDSRIRKIGVDSVEKKEGRIVVTHGSVVFDDAPIAAAFIEPTTGFLPDLQFVPESLTFEPLHPRSGETVFLNALLRNAGKASAEKINISGHDVRSVSNQKYLDAKVGKTGAALDRLDPGQEKAVRLRWDPTDNAGMHRLRLTADSDKRIRESDEENNVIESNLNVVRKADLIVDASSVDVQPIEGGKRLSIYFEIRNQGESPADKIVIELRRKAKGVEQPETFRLPKTYALEPGAHDSFGGIKIPSDTEYIEFAVDPDEIVDEETHANNLYRYETLH